MTFDEATNNVLLFGGDDAGPKVFGDTWTWDGSTKMWTQQFPSVSPTPRTAASLAYDPATKTVVLFGGADNTGPLGDSWIWDGKAKTWTQLFPPASPPARGQASMAYDSRIQSVVLFSGVDHTNSIFFQDTWTWDGTNWNQIFPHTVPHNRYAAGIDYDGTAHSLVLFGGYSSGPAIGDTWLLR
jgi:hypothetical protein